MDPKTNYMVFLRFSVPVELPDENVQLAVDSLEPGEKRLTRLGEAGEKRLYLLSSPTEAACPGDAQQEIDSALSKLLPGDYELREATSQVTAVRPCFGKPADIDPEEEAFPASAAGALNPEPEESPAGRYFLITCYFASAYTLEELRAKTSCFLERRIDGNGIKVGEYFARFRFWGDSPDAVTDIGVSALEKAIATEQEPELEFRPIEAYAKELPD